MREKRFLFVAMLFAALSLGFASCDNKGNEPEDPVTEQGSLTEEEILNLPIHMNKELYFNQHDAIQISFDTLNKYLAILNEDGSFVFDTIYMIPQGTFFTPDGYSKGGYFRLARSNLLEPRTSLSPRIRGKGDLVFDCRVPSIVPEDSLWLVEHGWTVNKYWVDLSNQNSK